MGSLNLVRDPWIPVRHRSGRRTTRAPWDIFGEPVDPVTAVASPRADFDGGITQFLIGLFQIVLAPRTEDEWIDRAEHPPDAGQLRSLLDRWAGAFELLDSGPRFQQDLRLASSQGAPWPIRKLLIELGRSNGEDLFARNGTVAALCMACVAAALATLQSSAPEGGRGHLASLRGAGPLTTLVIPVGRAIDTGQHSKEPDFWLTVWLNVVPLDGLHVSAPDPSRKGDILPWLGTANSPEPKRPAEVTPLDVHPLQVLFGMPRRLWLSDAVVGECGVCGATDVSVCQNYHARPNGIRYAGGWVHPLSPHRRSKKEKWFAFKGEESGIGYRHWLGLVVAPASSDVRPALTVQQLRGRVDRFDLAGALRLWAFGYAMDQMKAMAWSEGLMPIYRARDDVLEPYADEIRKLVESAELAERYLRFSFKKLIARRAQDVKREPDQISSGFWETTESLFYERARDVLLALERAEETLPARQTWHRNLVGEANRLFEAEVGEADFRAVDPAQVARSWRELQRSLYGQKLKTTLDLPLDKPKTRKGTKQ